MTRKINDKIFLSVDFVPKENHKMKIKVVKLDDGTRKWYTMDMTKGDRIRLRRLMTHAIVELISDILQDDLEEIILNNT